jgi:hypothetical protein
VNVATEKNRPPPEELLPLHPILAYPIVFPNLVFGHRHRFRSRRRRGLFRFSFRFGRRRRRRGLLLRHGFGSRFLKRIYFRSFGDDDLRLLTGLGEDGELRGGSLFATM